MPRQFLITVLLLACGLVPGRLTPGRWDVPLRLRDQMRNDLLNRADYEWTERRYYERLLEPDFGHRLDRLETAEGAPDPSSRAPKVRSGLWSASFDESPLIERVDDLREIVFKRNGSVENSGIIWSTNSQGMRDRIYETVKPPGTFRIAFVGDSIGAGWGVDAEARFESLLERSWNTRALKQSGRTVEIINCAVPGHSPGQRWSHFLQVGLPMNPDMILYEATAADIDWDERRLRVLLGRGVGWDSTLFQDVLDRVGARPGGTYEFYKRILKPWHWEILSSVYRTIGAECRGRSIPIVWMLVPRVGRTPTTAEHARLLKVARDAGFTRIVDVSAAFEGIPPAELTVAPEEYHPNEDGHARLAAQLDQALSVIPEIRSAWEAPAEIGPIVTMPVPPSDPSLVRASAEIPVLPLSPSPSGAVPR